MELRDARQLKELNRENTQLKKLVAELMRENRTSGLKSERVESEIWKDIRAPVTE